jgi:hypothetical protein
VVVLGCVVVGGRFTVVGVCGTVVVDFGGAPGLVVVVFGGLVVVVVGGGGGVYGPTYSLPGCIGVPTT